ncbi:MAG: DUF262 domain-containing protein [Oscillospiraceae bacterium]|nr:DUF262 domain-containing protein [Oscillospiraceae bacterium]
MQIPNKFDSNVDQLIRMMDKKQVDYDGAIQRGKVWDKKRKSRLIRSLLLKRAVGVFIFNKIGDNAYEALDGKQRSTAIYEFIKGDFALHPSFLPITDDSGNETPIAKRKFTELHEDLQSRITSYVLEIRFYNNLSQDEKLDIFEDINNGRPVTASDITRTKIKSRGLFESLAKHDAIRGTLSIANRNKKMDEDFATKVWLMCYSGSESLLNKDTAPILSSTEVTEDQVQGLTKILDYLKVLIKTFGKDKKMARKMKSITHFMSLGYMAHIAISKNLSAEKFAEKAIKFFSGEGNKASISDKYNFACGAGTAKADKVSIRKSEMEKALK